MKHRKALDLAIEQDFGGALDRTDWRRAFESSEPRDANRTMLVTGGCLAVLNACQDPVVTESDQAFRLARGTGRVAVASATGTDVPDCGHGTAADRLSGKGSVLVIA